MAVIIPKTSYIGIALARKDAKTGVPLGFLTPGGTDAAARKRISTVNSWVGYDGSHYDWVLEEDALQYEIDHPTAKMRKGDGTFDINDRIGKVRTIIPNVENEHYKIFDNVPNDPQQGFRLTKSITRGGGGWSGTSKVVRIEDPRGFELEIGTDNLVKVMTMTTIIHGVIQEECVWAREGSTNVLLPVNSDPYLEATVTTNRRNAVNVPLKSVAIGDTIDIKGESLPCSNKVQYMGLYREIWWDGTPEGPKPRNIYGSHSGRHDRGKDGDILGVSKRYVVYDREKKKYYGLGSIKVIQVLEREPDAPTDRPFIPIDQYKGTYQHTPLRLTTHNVKAKDLAKSMNFVPATVDASARRSYESCGYKMDKMFFTYIKLNQNNTEPQLVIMEKNWGDKSNETFVAKTFHLDRSINQWFCYKEYGKDGRNDFDVIKNPKLTMGLRIDDYEWLRAKVTINGEDVLL